MTVGKFVDHETWPLRPEDEGPHPAGPEPLWSESVYLGFAAEDGSLAFAPVAMTSPDGEVARFPRALCRFEAEDGRSGYGWTEWHQPPGWRGHRWR
ncbi:DUF7064 domain-containing protein [Streptosporangium sp. H16]|uniref:DUF7064 domain-containing protein n=1 Tax=Streptosporangium sp. H16 TaxID=3444184 RepID=UPI003F79E7FF